MLTHFNYSCLEELQVSNERGLGYRSLVEEGVGERILVEELVEEGVQELGRGGDGGEVE